MKTILLALVPALVYAQGTAADYQRASALRDKLQNLTVDVAGPVSWIDDSHFSYRKSIKGGHQFILVDAGAQSKLPAFDHEKLAVALSTASGGKFGALTLPFQEVAFADNRTAIEFAAASSMWKCTLADYACKKTGPAPANTGGRGGRGPEADEESPWAGEEEDRWLESPQQGQGGGRGGRGGAGRRDGVPAETSRSSPDGKWEALIQNFNVYVRPKGESNATALSSDGSEGNFYTLQSITWSPDSQQLVAYRRRPGYRREVHYVESSPADQLQPKHSINIYA
jgi:hypothetical protein